MARMTLAYNAERTDVLCAQMSGLMRRQSLQHFQAPPDEIRANRKAERHFDKLNDKFCSAHRGVRLLLLDLAPGRFAPAASPVQQHFACRQQLSAAQGRDDGLVLFCKHTDGVGVSVFAQRLPLVHAQDGAFKQSSDHFITPSAAVHQHEREGRVPLIVVEFQQSLAHWSLSESLCGPQSR